MGETRRPRENVVVGPKTGSGFVIRRLWAMVVDLDDGDEGIPLVMSPPWVDPPVACPLVGSDEVRVTWMREEARKHARFSGKPVRLVRFSVREELETFHPDGTTSRKDT
jgi:hypothetical protein